MSENRGNIEKLKVYKKQFGHCNVPSGWSHDRVLSQWVENIRKRKHLLSNELRKQLIKLDFDFNYNVADNWETMYEKLREFYLKNGHSEIPPSHPEYELLSTFIHKQRASQKRLAKKQIEKLDEIDFIWKERWSKYKAQWLTSFDKLKSHYLKFGTSWISWKDRHQFPELADWCRMQVKIFRKGKLSEDKVRLLDSIEFDWDAGRKKQAEQKWLRQFEDLKRFKKVYGHIQVPGHKKEFRRLYSWMVSNRAKSDSLTSDQKKKLNAIGFRWSREIQNKKQERWNAMYERLTRFYRKHGHINVTRTQDEKLIRWLRAQEERASIPANRRKKLEKLGMIWTKERKKNRREHWNKMYQELKKFYLRNGHFVVPVKNKELRQWIGNLRTWNKVLTPEQREKLKAIDFDFDWRRNDFVKLRWEKRYSELKHFKEKFGHCNVSKHTGDYKSLGLWVGNQRRRKTQLSSEQIKKLDRLKFSWVVGMGRKPILAENLNSPSRN